MLAGDTNAYYRVNGSPSTLLTVSINFSQEFNLDLYLYDIAPNHDLIDASQMTGTSDTVEYHVSIAGEYYIKVNRFLGTGDVNFTLTITIRQEFQIPGFELLYIFYSILIALGIVIFYKKRRDNESP